MTKIDNTISRWDLIAAGADFSFICMETVPSFRNPVSTTWEVAFSHSLCSAELIKKTEYGVSKSKTFNTTIDFATLRQEVAKHIEVASPLYAKALCTPWSPHSNCSWPDPVWAKAHGLNIDALLYSAVDRDECGVAMMYLDDGANPLAKTYLGDCAARLGVAGGMISVFKRPEWLDATNETTGETGLFGLARCNMIDLLVEAYRCGANPDVRNLHGQTVLDYLHSRLLGEADVAIAEARATRISANTVNVEPLVKGASQHTRRL